MPEAAFADPAYGLVTPLALAPLGHGALDGTTFTVKDVIDIAGHKTSFGSPAWREAHPAPVYNALCVDQMLAAGARCVGKVTADEFTYSLDGQNPFFGTPRNAKAPERIPGGSSSGSAASVGNGLADFSLGTDSGGSVRVPASLCGLWGLRPSLHRISEAGVLPFMPSVSTVGLLAARFEHLQAASHVALRSADARPEVPLRRLVVLADALEIADAAVQGQARPALERVAQRAGVALETIRFGEIIGEDVGLEACNATALRELQTLEFQNTVGNWIEIHHPDLGFDFSKAYERVRAFDRVRALGRLARCERLFEAINAFLTPGTILAFPTTPTIAPLKGSLNSVEAVVDFYGRTMTITALAGVGRLPEVSAPLLTVDDCPCGLSFAARHYQDEFLLAAVKDVAT